MNPNVYYNPINNNLASGISDKSYYMPPQQQQYFPNQNCNNNQYTQYNQFNQYPMKNYGNYYQKQNHQVDENSLMESLKYVSEKYPHLIKLNQSYFGLTQKVRNQVNPRFFVIKSFTEEDIHKVNLIKYIVYQI